MKIACVDALPNHVWGDVNPRTQLRECHYCLALKDESGVILPGPLNAESLKPPLGIKPFALWVHERQDELARAISRSQAALDHSANPAAEVIALNVRAWAEELAHLETLRLQGRP